MKKIFILIFSAAAITLSACGGQSQEQLEKEKQDSIKAQREQDSILNLANQFAADDSTTASDSAKKDSVEKK